jgi:low temperature requirement protein LtrA
MTSLVVVSPNLFVYLSISIQYGLHLTKTKHKPDYKTCQAFALVALIVAILSFVSFVWNQAC